MKEKKLETSLRKLKEIQKIQHAFGLLTTNRSLVLEKLILKS